MTHEVFGPVVCVVAVRRAGQGDRAGQLPPLCLSSGRLHPRPGHGPAGGPAAGRLRGHGQRPHGLPRRLDALCRAAGIGLGRRRHPVYHGGHADREARRDSLARSFRDGDIPASPHFSAATNSSFAGLHSLTGVVFVGGYLAFHLAHQRRRAGRAGDLSSGGRTRSTPSAPRRSSWSNGAFVLLPILFHGLIGLVIVTRGKRNMLSYPYAGNIRYTLQRWTGVIAFAFILWHVFHTRGWLVSGGGGSTSRGRWAAGLSIPSTPPRPLRRAIRPRPGGRRLLGGRPGQRLPPGQRRFGRPASPGACGPAERAQRRATFSSGVGLVLAASGWRRWWECTQQRSRSKDTPAA